MRLTVLILMAGSVLPKIYASLKLACVLVPLDHVARFIVNANHGIVRAAAKLCVADCVTDCFSSVVNVKSAKVRR